MSDDESDGHAIEFHQNAWAENLDLIIGFSVKFGVDGYEMIPGSYKSCIDLIAFTVTPTQISFPCRTKVDGYYLSYFDISIDAKFNVESEFDIEIGKMLILIAIFKNLRRQITKNFYPTDSV